MPDDITPFMAPIARRSPGSEERQLAHKAGLMWDDARQSFVPEPVNPICGKQGCPVTVTHSHESVSVLDKRTETFEVGEPRALRQADEIVGMVCPDPGQEPSPADPPGVTETDPTGRVASDPGSKLDAGKAPIYRGLLDYFPHALRAVAEVSEVGARKYSWGAWRCVPDGVSRYTDALGRHLLDEGAGPYDDGPGGTGALHAAQVAWNALARLELILRS